jgi:hypothetical protein
VSPTLSGAARRFEAAYSPLRESAAQLGEIAVLGWDADIFGFPVGDYRFINPSELALRPDQLAEALSGWADREKAELIGCRIPATHTATGALLESIGFRFVEAQLRAVLPRLRFADLRPPRITIRPVHPADHDGVLRIAESAFTLGRYHADPRFPRALADRRYRVWVERALTEPHPGTLILVVGPEGAPGGFLHAEIDMGIADIRLAAVERGAAGIAGPELFRGALHEFTSRGAMQVTARFSAANNAVLNIYASFGFRFDEPENVFHWHRPNAAHLVPLVQAFAHLP